MDFKEYPSYKNSGVEWLGDVPEHWIVCLFKRQIVRNDGGVWGEEPTGHNDTIVFRSTEQTMDGRWNIVNPALRNLSDKEKKSALLEEGDLLLTKSSGSSLHIGKTTLVDVEIAKNRCCYSNFMQRIRTTKTYNSTLGWYVLNNQLTREQFSVFSTSTTGLANLNSEIIGNIHIVVPPVNEQLKVIEYLDTETTRIDNLIAKQEKLIELLEEQRKSIISHAVTKGLNPNAPMKDSGVEWLGDVPEHWEVTFIKYITKKISSGKTPLGGAEVYTDEGVIFLRSQNIYNDGLHLDDVSFIPHEIHASMKSSAVKKNDVLLNITGGSIGRTCLVDCEIGEANVNQHVCIIRTSKDKYAKWLSVFMKSNSAQSQIFYSQTGAGREGLNFSQIGNMRLLFPPFVEQQEILDFLDQENLRFDNLILKQQSLIEKMKEYRASIISHAVTGKIDVREFGR